MRRAYLLAGIAAGAVLVFTTAATVASVPLNRASRLSRHMDKVQHVAYCRMGYEIASSFPSYASRTAISYAAKKTLLNRSDELFAQHEHLGELLRGTFKAEALKLGMDEFSYENVLAKFEAKAEVEAVVSFQSVNSTNEFIDKLDETCATYNIS